MRIHSMTATFGKLEHATLTLESGLNLIDAPNEWGKSTWCAFILTMLYGLDTRERSTKTSLADKECYAPWSGSSMSGRMELEWQGRSITIERRSKGRTPMGEFAAYETETGVPVKELTAANCGQVLLGVERSVFSRSGFLRGADMPVTMNEELRSRLNALVTTGDDSGMEEELGAKLKELKNRCRYNRTGLIPQTQTRREQLEKHLGEYHALEGQVRQLEQQIRILESQKVQEPDSTLLENAIRQEETARLRCQELERQCASLPDRETALNPAPHKNPKLTLFICAALCLACGAALLTLGWVPALVSAAVGICLLIAGLVMKPREEIRQQISDRWDRLDEAREELRQAQQRVTALQNIQRPEQAQARQEQLRQLHLKLGQCQGRMETIGEPHRLRRELEQVTTRLTELELTERALIVALDALDEARAELQRRFAPGITRRAQILFARLTGGRYDRLSLGQELSVLAGAQGEDTLRGPLWRSEGTTDQLYLALRLAVAEELTPAAPLILDDALVRFDDDRLGLALELLEETAKEKQVILFSCRHISERLQ